MASWHSHSSSFKCFAKHFRRSVPFRRHPHLSLFEVLGRVFSLIISSLMSLLSTFSVLRSWICSSFWFRSSRYFRTVFWEPPGTALPPQFLLPFVAHSLACSLFLSSQNLPGWRCSGRSIFVLLGIFLSSEAQEAQETDRLNSQVLAQSHPLSPPLLVF